MNPLEASLDVGFPWHQHPAWYAVLAERSTMDLGDRIVVDAAILVGKPVVRGTRLAVEFVIELLAQGWSEDDILKNYPGLVHEDIQACLAYASNALRMEKVYALSGPQG